MASSPDMESTTEREAELERLRARVAALEDELIERTARANAAVAAAEDRAYWLDRWRLDLNALMRRPGAHRARTALRFARMVYRKLREARQELPVAAAREREAAELAARGPVPEGGTGFERAAAPSRLSTSEVTDLLYERLDEDAVREVESRLSPDEREELQAAGRADRRRLTIHLGVHHDVRQVIERTGLTPDMPPPEVHAMARVPAAAGGSSYYADVVVDALREGGMDPAAARRGLDFGCSSGRVVRVLAATFPEVEWYGCDPIAPAIEWASANLPGIDFRVSPQRPPLPYGQAEFDFVFAISIWSHFAEPAAVAWLEEMRRIIRPGGLLVLTTAGHWTLAHDFELALRSPEQLSQMRDALYGEGFWFRDEFGEGGDHGITEPDWGTALMTPEWLLTRATPRWRLALYAPGRVEDSQDLYVVERQP